MTSIKVFFERKAASLAEVYLQQAKKEGPCLDFRFRALAGYKPCGG